MNAVRDFASWNTELHDEPSGSYPNKSNSNRNGYADDGDSFPPSRTFCEWLVLVRSRIWNTISYITIGYIELWML